MSQKNSKPNGKSSKNYKKGKTFDKKSDFKSESGSSGKFRDFVANYEHHSGNDIGWWNKIATLFDDVTRIPFNKITGRFYPTTDNIGKTGFSSFDRSMQIAEPGIMRVNYVPGIGVAETYNDAPNRAFQSLWSAIYSKTTGILEFPPYMLGLFTICAQSVAQNIAQVKRALKCSHLYTANNAYYPVALLEACGFAPDSIIGHQDEVRVIINDIIRDFNSLTIPAYIDVFKRHYTLCSNVYADQDSIAAQLYLFTPDVSYVYSDRGTYNAEDGDYDGLACAVAVKSPNAYGLDGYACDILDFMAFIKMQLAVIRNSTDTVKIMGSLLRAMPDSAFITIEPVTVDEVMVPAIEDEIAYQLHNATIVGSIYNEFENTTWADSQSGVPEDMRTTYVYKNGAITTDPVSNIIKYRPKLLSGALRNCVITDGYLLNTFANTIGKDEIMLYTRLMSNWELGPEITPTYQAADLGTEFITDLVVYRNSMGTDNQLVTHKTSYAGLNTVDLAEDYSAQTMSYAMTLLNRFHRAPRVQWYLKSKSGDFVTNYSGDLNLWTTVDAPSLKGLHAAALLSVFNTTTSVPIK